MNKINPHTMNQPSGITIEEDRESVSSVESDSVITISSLSDTEEFPAINSPKVLHADVDKTNKLYGIKPIPCSSLMLSNSTDTVIVGSSYQVQSGSNDSQFISEMKNEGFIHIPVLPDGRCCYNSMTNIVNIDRLLNNEEQLGASVVISQLATILTHLKDQCLKSNNILNEIAILLEVNTKKETVIQVIELQLQKIQDFFKQQDSKETLPKKSWGSSRLFGLLGLINQVQVDNFQMTTIAKRRQKQNFLKKHKPSCISTVPNSFESFPKTLKLIKNLLKIKRADKKKLSRYIIGYHSEHFDTWLTQEQSKIVKEKIGLKRCKRRRSNVKKSSRIKTLIGLLNKSHDE